MDGEEKSWKDRPRLDRNGLVVTRIVCAAKCDEKQPFAVRTRKTFRKLGGLYFCEPCAASARRPS